MKRRRPWLHHCIDWQKVLSMRLTSSAVLNARRIGVLTLL